MTTWLNMTLFIWLLMTALKVLFKLIILINQTDGRGDPECWKPGTKIEHIKLGIIPMADSKWGRAMAIVRNTDSRRNP